MSPLDVNPIIPGFAPDPSIALIGNTYFLVTSSFHLFPGLPIYASRDLLNWRQIGNGINRTTQLSLSKSITNLVSRESRDELIPATGGLYAPTIRHFKGTTYIVCTNVIHDVADRSQIDFQNFIISTSDIWSNQWSDPIYFDFRGIDPSLYFDEQNRAYVQGSSWGPPTTINSFEIDLATGAKLSSEKVIWDGFSKVIPEGPHLFKRGEWLYLFVAEGGTHDGHQITVARSKSIWGPFESCPSNPILKPCQPGAFIQYTGHGDAFLDDGGEWWVVCLGARKTGNSCIMGRESFLTPMKWDDDNWPVITPIQLSVPLTGKQASKPLTDQHNKAEVVHPLDAFVSIRDPSPIHEAFQSNREAYGSKISLRPTKADLSDCSGPVAFIGQRQRRLQGIASASVDVGKLDGNVPIKAGIALYKDEHRFCRIFWDADRSAVVLEHVNRAKSLEKSISVEVSQPGQIRFCMSYSAEQIRFAFEDSATGVTTDLGVVSTEDMTGDDFVGPIIGVFAVGDSKICCEVVFEGFEIDKLKNAA